MLFAAIAAVALASTTSASAELSPTPWLMPRNGSYDPSLNISGILPCEALKAAGLGDRLLFATDAGYEPQIESWYSANARMRPYCLVLPHNTKEVSTALTALVNANDGAGDWHIAIRSGGHSWPGSNNIADGVTIDLTMMNSSSYDKQTNLAKIQPGGRWGNVYTNLYKYGVTVTGGRDGDVGVGGFLLGGGNSFFSGRMGFGCDTVVNFEVVLANGTIVNANNTTNSDLWRALKGGGSNFGIVTRYDMEAIPAKDIYYELRILSSDYSDDVVDAVVGFTNQNQSLADNALVTFYSYNSSASPDIYIGLIHVNTQGNANSSTTFDKLRTLPNLRNATALESMAKAAVGSQVPGGTNNFGTTLTFRNDPQIIRRCVELHEEYVETLKRSINPDKFVTYIFFQPLPSYMAQISHRKGGNMLGLDSIPYNGILWDSGVAVDPSEGEAAFAVAQLEASIFTARVKEATRSLNGEMDFVYLNYADASQDVLGSYGAANIQHMRDVAASYDPTEIFQRRVPGGFKISRVACKSRKTKCDRRLPCSSCVTLNIACRTTPRPSEKRQRVLISSKYDEAVQDVRRQLSDVKEMLQALMLSKTSTPCSTGETSEATHHTPPPMIDEQVPSLSKVREGYNGDTSFQSHAHQVKNALEAALAASELLNVDTQEASTTLSPRKVAELLRGAEASDTTPSAPAATSSLPSTDDLDFGKLPLPPVDLVLKLLRLAKSHKQQFFVDIPFFQEDEFIDMCRGVYFATEPISLWTWICVNVGLYHLFSGVNEVERGRMGTTVEAMRSHCGLLKANADAAMQCLRLCSEPSRESCRALALLGSFYVKQGHSTIAWRLISAAARACLDLGFHRLSENVGSQDQSQKASVFWNIYCWEKGLAMTSGRTPIIHHYDVTTPIRTGRVDAPARVYSGFLHQAIIMGEIQQTLFSGSARHASQQTRSEYVRGFAARIISILESVKSATQTDPTWDEMYTAAALLVELISYSLLTIVYRILPPRSTQPHPLQCSDECVDSARRALSKLVEVGDNVQRRYPANWVMFLNITLSLVPFVPFIVLAGNAIATSSDTDLALLSSVVSILAPTSASSPTIQKIHDACESFGRIANLVVSSANKSPLGSEGYQIQVHDHDLAVEASKGSPRMPSPAQPGPVDYGFPMAQQDWDSVMMGFESELGDYDSRALTNIIEPYITNTSW
ncbi:uncharacterized protein F4807DRAFT_471636 [Annulohypoxylon truncatum]|uniref:uncharacterized protein n=1 Tax=Annulohypoxylon truncatum TaxID=327061 RepID=UPI0020085C80|nr:uncharacterized protein F4807DRAFT_471636 [Annulohypoxylon truncatum]KAI1213190.1 hypothetical protein F4807DRAFT_471636 [Annulohypoxylon truncatum]